MQVKVVNLRSANLEREMMGSITETGFVVLTHHGISHELIKDVQQEWREFFLSPQITKNFHINKTDGNMGYKGTRTEKAVGAKVADLKEFYHWKPGLNIPQSVSGNTQNLFYQLNDVAGQILTVIDQHEEKNGRITGYSEACRDSDNTLLRTLYYPAMDFGSEPSAVRAAAHEDINFITLLVAASAPGLQVLDTRNTWHDVPHEENSIVVNIGDMLQLASGGKYKSTTHRVVNPSKNTEDRISMPLFAHPHSDTLLAPGITAKQFLNQRLAEIYGVGQ